jgi:ABC-type nitrate/sulfonate/bicarbonate transport system permease component
MTRRILLLAIEIAVPTAIVAGIVIWSERAQSYYYPPAGKVWAQFDAHFLQSDVGLQNVLWPTLSRMLQGYLAAAVVGVLAGIALASSQRLMRMFFPIIEFFRATPSPTLIPFIVLVFGISDFSQIILITLGCVWPILLNTIDGLRSCDPVLLETSRSYGVGPVARAFRVRLPAASPQIFAGLRTSMAIALILAVVAEMLTGTNGVGYYINEGQSLFNLSQMWTGILVLGVVGYALNALFLIVEKTVLAWHRGAKEGAT